MEGPKPLKPLADLLVRGDWFHIDGEAELRNQ